MKKPEPMKEPDLTKLKEITGEFVNNIVDRTSSEENYDGIAQFHIFVVAMKTIYGDDIFTWVRNNE